MDEFIRLTGWIWTAPVLLVITLATSLAWSRATGSEAASSTSTPGWEWTTVSVELPTSETSFPPGDGAEITPQCLICHSAGMVLRQPPLTRDQWIGEINKMRAAFGAPLPADQVDRLANYLYRINGSSAARSAVDAQGS